MYNFGVTSPGAVVLDMYMLTMIFVYFVLDLMR